MKPLSLNEENQLRQYLAYWSNFIEQIEPERSEIETAIAGIYRYNKLETPPIVFADSPWQMFSMIILLRLLILSEDALELKAKIGRRECSDLFRHLLAQVDAQIDVAFLQELNEKMSFGKNAARALFSYSTYIIDSRKCLGHGLIFGPPGGWVEAEFRKSAESIHVHDQVRRGALADVHGPVGNLLSRDLGRAFRLLRDELLAVLPEETQSRLRKIIFREIPEDGDPSIEDNLASFLADEWQLLRKYVSWTIANRRVIAVLVALSRVRPNLTTSRTKEYLAHWSVLSRNSAAVIAFEKVCVVTKPPVAVQIDENNRIHSESDSSVTFADGYGVYSWHNLRVDPSVILKPVTIDMIRSESNVEVRRVLIERYGLSRFLLDSGAELIHEDTFGWLYRTELPDDEPLVMVKLLNSTPEPDGSIREYFLRVPPTVATAREAVAWTFNLSADEYGPTAES